MTIEIVSKPDITICGLQTKLTTSQKENYQIIRSNWQNFNKQLRINNLKSNKNWEKFGVITKTDESYFYLSGIQFSTEIIDFKNYKIKNSNFAKFFHKGDLQSIRSTVHDIYKNRIPNSDLKIDLKRSLIHFEHYDHRFHWSRSDSIIEIFVPLLN
jgi:predicted transcriptional regulator YdeE